MSNVAWIGTGVMGSAMTKNLLKHGYQVSVYNRTPDKAKALVKDGAVFCPTVAQAVKDADFIFTIVGYPKDVEEVYLGEGGIFQHAKPGAVCVDMTSSSPSLAEKLYEEGLKKDIHMLDAPVSGSDIGAQNGTLSIMVGGDQQTFDKARPLFECLGQNINLLGKAGSGQHTKVANQIAVAGAVSAMTEAIVYARAVGLDPEKMLAAISSGAAGSWQINNMAPRVLKKDFAPGFYIKHFLKDMNIARSEAQAHDADLKMLETAFALYSEMQELGFENDGTQALIKRYEAHQK